MIHSKPARGIASRAFLAGGGEMGARMRALDWNSTSLGAAELWPQSLRTAVGLLLSSKYPMFIAWGEQLAFLYNDGYRPVFGKGAKHPAALGQPFAQVWAEIWPDIEPLVARALAGEATWSENLQLFMERSGYVEEVYFTFSYSPIHDETGGVGGMFCACNDTTGEVLNRRRQRTLEQLGTVATEARTVADAHQRCLSALAANPHDLPFAVLCRQDRGALHLIGAVGGDVDATRLSGLACGAEGREIADVARLFVEGAPASAWGEPVRSAFAVPILGRSGGEGVMIAGLNPRRALDDSYREFLNAVANRIATALANARAYESERVRAEQLTAINVAKNTFFANVSHEFRTPLTLIMGPLQQLLHDVEYQMPEEARAALQLAQGNAVRLLRLVNTLLDFSRIEAGRMRADFRATDLADLTVDLCGVFRSAMEQAGLEFDVQCPPLPEPAWVDEEMWEKIVLNLLSNAFKYTLRGSVRLALAVTEDAFELSVEDTGVGIPAEALPHLFERFYRVPNTQARSHEGTGIGLTLVQELVKMHGGTIDVTSREGVGTTFRVSIPRGHAHLPAEQVLSATTAPRKASIKEYFAEEVRLWTSAAAHDLQPESLPAPVRPPGGALETGERARVLLADDNADMRRYLRSLLSLRFDVIAAADGEEALQLALRDPPDLVLTDIMMPRLDAFGLMRALRADSRTADLPIILISARAGEEARLEGLGAGADDYLIKPFSARELIARVETHVKLAHERRASLRSLRESEQRFRNMADNAPVMIWVEDAQGSVAYASRSWYDFTGQSEHAALGEGWLEAVHPDDRAALRATFARVMVERKPFQVEYRVRRRDGVYRWALDSATPRFDEEGNFLGFMGSVLDIDDRKRAEQDLREADRRKDEFLATLAHELRNPLAPVRHAATIARTAGLGVEQLRWSMEVIDRQVQHMALLLDDLMDASRISRGKLELRKSAVELDAVVRAAIETARPGIDQKHQGLDVEIPRERIVLDADPLRLAQVLANLLINASKYTDRGGHLFLAARKEDAQLVISVRDTGIGIAPEALPGIFRMFSQVTSAIARAEGGLGIGLALTRGLVELHGGTISAHSEGVGRGSEFIVRLPLEAALQPTAPDPESERPTTPSRRILVVDDNRDAGESLALLLQLAGHEVTTANNAEMALEVATAFAPQIALLDIGMPGCSGYELAERIRAQSWGQELTLIALTGWGQEEDKRKAFRAGFDHHLTKPVDPQQLATLLATASVIDAGSASARVQ